MSKEREHLIVAVFSGESVRARNQILSGTRSVLKRAPDRRVAFITRKIWDLDGKAISTVEKFTTCDARNFVWLKHNNNKRIICIVAVYSHIILSFVIESVMNNLGTQKQLGQNLEQISRLSYFVLFFIRRVSNCSPILESADSENSNAPISRTLLWTW